MLHTNSNVFPFSQQWGLDTNKMLFENDFWWSVCLFVHSLALYRQWHGSKWRSVSWVVGFISILALATYLQIRHKSVYLRHRVHILVAMRYARMLGLILLLDPAIPDLLRLHEASCARALTKILVYRVGYVLTAFIGYQLPLLNHIWVVVLNVLSMSVLSIRHCKQAGLSLPGSLNCARAWGEKVAWMGKLSPFAASGPSSSLIEPWQECGRLQVPFIVSCLCAFKSSFLITLSF